MALEHYLHLQVGIRCASFHEDLSLLERDRAAAYFADEESGARALICSEIGSEGRNFQFSQHLVCFDLPHHPDLLEQRIGRLDRIGQYGDVNIHVPITPNTSEAVRFTWFNEGLNGFETSCSIGHLMYDELAEELSTSEAAGQLAPQLLARTIGLREQLNQQMDRGRDRLLELTSHNSSLASQLITEIADNERTRELRRFTDNLFDRLGIHTEEGSEDCLILKPSENLITGELPFLDEGGITCTFERDLALARDDLHFLTWEHPLVRETIDIVYNSELGNASVAMIKAKSITPGTVLVETIHTADCPAPKRLEIGRHLEQVPLRSLITLDGRDLGAAISCENLTKLIKPVSITQSAGVIRELRPKLVAALSELDKRAESNIRNLQTKALASADRALGAEAERLKALGERNGSVRNDEIEAVQQLLTEIREAVARTEPRLQGIRVVVAT